MSLSWKDLANTILVFAILTFSYLTINGFQVLFISNYRWATGVVLVLGIAMCAMGSANVGASSGGSGVWIKVAAGFGILTLLLVVAGLITGAKIVFIGLVTTILLLWLIATSRHLLI